MYVHTCTREHSKACILSLLYGFCQLMLGATPHQPKLLASVSALDKQLQRASPYPEKLAVDQTLYSTLDECNL